MALPISARETSTVEVEPLSYAVVAHGGSRRSRRAPARPRRRPPPLPLRAPPTEAGGARRIGQVSGATRDGASGAPSISSSSRLQIRRSATMTKSAGATKRVRSRSSGSRSQTISQPSFGTTRRTRHAVDPFSRAVHGSRANLFRCCQWLAHRHSRGGLEAQQHRAQTFPSGERGGTRVAYAAAVTTQAEPVRQDESPAWWVRVWLVAQAPRSVFAALRDDSREAAEERQDAIAVIVFLAGLALTLVSSQAASFADDPGRAGIVIPVWLFIAGLLVGLVNYWLAGGVLYLALNWLGAQSSYRQARHLLALAAVPLALSLVLLPLRLALYGGDIFRSGGADSGSGAHVFPVLEVAFGLWLVVLLAIGVRLVEGWTWRRTVSAVVAFGVLVAVVDLALSLFG